MALLAIDKPVSSKPKRISYREFLASSPEDAHVEWVNGEIVPMAPISDEHQDMDGFLLTLLRTYVNQKELGFVLHEPFQMKTGPKLPGRSPDILFVASENKGIIHSKVLDGFWINPTWLWQHPLPSEWSIIKQWKLD